MVNRLIAIDHRRGRVWEGKKPSETEAGDEGL
jgi:hypothetical protein